MDKHLVTVTLAAGLGTRMKSKKPKVLHPVGGRSMLAHVLDLATQLGSAKNAVVLGPEVENDLDQVIPDGVARRLISSASAMARPMRFWSPKRRSRPMTDRSSFFMAIPLC